MRQIVLDTETTGLETSQDHRIIEIGCVELVNRKLTGNHYHQYINPEREIDDGALQVHGISNEFLADKPVFDKVAKGFIEFVRGAELVIHNAPFDVGFLNHELKKLDDSLGLVEEHCKIVDSLVLARQKHPGQKNNLDALCKRYFVDNSQRDLHGALLDAEILADVYLAMTGGQVDLMFAGRTSESADGNDTGIRRLPSDRAPLKVIESNEQELAEHHQKLQDLNKACGDTALWEQIRS